MAKKPQQSEKKQEQPKTSFAEETFSEMAERQRVTDEALTKHFAKQETQPVAVESSHTYEPGEHPQPDDVRRRIDERGAASQAFFEKLAENIGASGPKEGFAMPLPDTLEGWQAQGFTFSNQQPPMGGEASAPQPRFLGEPSGPNGAAQALIANHEALLSEALSSPRGLGAELVEMVVAARRYREVEDHAQRRGITVRELLLADEKQRTLLNEQADLLETVTRERDEARRMLKSVTLNPGEKLEGVLVKHHAKAERYDVLVVDGDKFHTRVESAPWHLAKDVVDKAVEKLTPEAFR